MATQLILKLVDSLRVIDNTNSFKFFLIKLKSEFVPEFSYSACVKLIILLRVQSMQLIVTLLNFNVWFQDYLVYSKKKIKYAFGMLTFEICTQYQNIKSRERNRSIAQQYNRQKLMSPAEE